MGILVPFLGMSSQDSATVPVNDNKPVAVGQQQNYPVRTFVGAAPRPQGHLSRERLPTLISSNKCRLVCINAVTLVQVREQITHGNVLSQVLHKEKAQ